MSYSKETTIWCDAEGCDEWITHPTPRVSEARELSEETKNWDCGSDRDLCPTCK